jgi:hypothetical protein
MKIDEFVHGKVKREMKNGHFLYVQNGKGRIRFRKIPFVTIKKS